MEIAKKIIFYTVGILAIFILHVFVVSFLPPPLNHLNIIIAALLWILLYRSIDAALWAALALGLVMELYSSVPFGLHLLAFLFSLTLVRWLLLTIFTSHSLLIVAVASLVASMTYRGLLLLLVVITSFLARQPPVYDSSIWFDYFSEFILTAGALVVSGMITRHWRRRLNPRYIAIENT